MIPDQHTWDIGDKVKFDARSFDWVSWVGTLKTCEFPQVAVYDCVVRIHYIEGTQSSQVIAYGVVISHQTSTRAKESIHQKDLLQKELREMGSIVIEDTPPRPKVTFKEGVKERLIAERDENRKRSKSRPDYQSMIRSNIKGFNK